MAAPALTKNQRLVLETLYEHRINGGRAIGNREVDAELNRRHNRTMGYDMLHSLLVRLDRRGLVDRDASRPARWSCSDSGAVLCSADL